MWLGITANRMVLIICSVRLEMVMMWMKFEVGHTCGELEGMKIVRGWGWKVDMFE